MIPGFIGRRLPNGAMRFKAVDTVSRPVIDPDWLMVTNTMPADVWAPDIIGQLTGLLVADLEAAARGKVVNWATLTVTTIEAGDVVHVTAGASVL